MTDRPKRTLILNIGRDASLLGSRTGVLVSAGYSAAIALNKENALSLSQDESFGLAIVCHSFGSKEQRDLQDKFSVLRPNLKVMLMKITDDNSPAEFLQRVGSLVAGSVRS